MSTVTATAAPATDAQITRALIPALEGRDWSSVEGMDRYVSRAAVLNTVLGFATHPMADDTPAVFSRVMSRNATHGERANQLLAYLASESDQPEYLTAPLTKQGASALIDWLFTLPYKARAQEAPSDLPSIEEVPAGRYAVDTEDGAINETAFYKVDRPTEGRWAGYVFVKHIVGDDEQRLSRAASATVLAKISSVGAEAASARYGHEIGACGICGRQLSNDESRERGIGPICADKVGW